MLNQTLVFAFSCLVCANAHGGVWKYEIEGKLYEGYKWWEPYEGQVSMQYRWPNRSPFWTAIDPDLACNVGGIPTSPNIYAPVHAGSVIKAHYDKNFSIPGEYPSSTNQTWSHTAGPIFVYMAECPEYDCGKVDPKAPIWFKVYEAGLMNGTWPAGYWAMAGLFHGETLDFAIPKDMKPGRYLIRHELISIEVGLKQLFPECAQIEVIGNGSSIPGSDYTRVAFPGAYSDSGTTIVDPGLNVTAIDFYVVHENDTHYPMPGPPLWKP
ncbi:cellulose-growth-specific protein [Crepidotus variabilis]|uniref:AA9 family lytic polysaccharide monooxygenase n=1 Tax=Crepidotus variabilis TaxID=179855 RepID=A0A9P6ED08_9AGAR|nr:cellulose-growth-specific protein [Crepidotus variabilis]